MKTLLKPFKLITLSKIWTGISVLALWSSLVSITTLANTSVCVPELTHLSQLSTVINEYAHLVYDTGEKPEDSPGRILSLQLLTAKAKELQALIESLDGPQLTSARVKALIDKAIATQRLLSEEDTKNLLEEELRARRIEEGTIKEIGRVALFNTIEPGEYKMASAQNPVTITKPFELMMTLMTQVIYREVAIEANKILPQDSQIEVSPSEFKSDLMMVERVSFYDTVKWINALNKLMEMNNPIIKKLFPTLKPGQFFDLPTDAEFEFVLRGAGNQHNDAQYPLGLTLNEMRTKARFNENFPRDVAQLDPYIIGEKVFYDLVGLGEVWVKDAYTNNPPGGKDPLITESPMRTTRSAGFRSARHILEAGYRSQYTGGYKSSEISFRLVIRDLPLDF